MGTGQALRAAAEPHVADDRVPGLVALAARGGETHAVALGTLTAGADRPVQRDSLFRIASVTKPITGAATLALAAEGLLSLDEPAGCCPNWPAAGCCAGWTGRWTTPSRPAARSPSGTC